MINSQLPHRPSLLSAIAIGISSIIGSGWLFAVYKAAKFAGPIAIGAWIIGASLALALAILLAEIASIYPHENALSARLLTITHNPDFGFTLAACSWLSIIAAIPAEAESSMQYLAHAFPYLQTLVFNNQHFTYTGIGLVSCLLVIYGLLNYWGIKLLTHANNLITLIKLVVPILTALIFFKIAFHPTNFSGLHNTTTIYQIKHMFSSVATCGIFYSFYGFAMIPIFCKELANPQKNIPLALIISILICLVIYLMLQISFIGAINPRLISEGWHTLNMNSPLAELAIILNANWLALILYINAALAPSGTAVIYVGSCARLLNGMALDKQIPQLFAATHPLHHISRSALIVTIIICGFFVLAFDSWDKIMIVVSAFQLITCAAIPIAFSTLRKTAPNIKRPLLIKGGVVISYLVYLAISYLLIQCGFKTLSTTLFTISIFFLLYCIIHYPSLVAKLYSFASAWSIFSYLVILTLYSHFHNYWQGSKSLYLISLTVSLSINYHYLINQKFYTSSSK